MKKNIQNSFIAFALLFGSTSFGQTCETTILEDDLSSPSLVLTCDFNGDGSEDLVYLDLLNNDLYWKRNTGSDVFTTPLPLVGDATINFLKSADLNDDGYDEIIIATSTTVYYILYTGPGTIDFGDLFTTPVLYYIDALAIGDFNNDGSDGMVIASSKTSTYTARVDLINNDDASLSVQNIFEGTIGSISDLAVGDITGNGKKDIAMAGYSNLWFKNTGIGDFTSEYIISSASSDWGRIALHDYDNDDDVELIVLDTDGKLKAYGIDLTGGGWIYDPITLITGLPTEPQTWVHTSLNGSDALLLSSANEIIALEHSGSSYSKVIYCSGISDLNGLALFHREDGLIEFVFSRESEGTIEKMNDAETNEIDEIISEQWEVYPNPTSDFINVIAENNSEIKNIQAINTFGQIIEIKSTGNNQYSVQHLASGLYKLLITDVDGNLSTKSFLKIN